MYLNTFSNSELRNRWFSSQKRETIKSAIDKHWRELNRRFHFNAAKILYKTHLDSNLIHKKIFKMSFSFILPFLSAYYKFSLGPRPLVICIYIRHSSSNGNSLFRELWLEDGSDTAFPINIERDVPVRSFCRRKLISCRNRSANLFLSSASCRLLQLILLTSQS